MLPVLLSLLLAQFAFAASEPPSLDEEREALEELQTKFDQFRVTVAAADTEFARLRGIVMRPEFRSPATETITSLVRTANRQWREIENFYEKQKELDLDLHRLGHDRHVEISDEVTRYLAIRKSGRFNSGVAPDLLLAMWRGLGEGEKAKSPPVRLARTTTLSRLALTEDDSLLIMLVNGGLIRGRFIGVEGNRLVIREVLNGPFTYAQTRSGNLRKLTLDNVARLEVIRRPETMSQTLGPPSVIDEDGFYSRYNARQGLVFRLDYRPDDIEMVELIRAGRANEIRHRPRVTEAADVTPESRPNYSHVFFDDCGSLLGGS